MAVFCFISDESSLRAAEEKPEAKPEQKPSTGVNTGDAFNSGILGGMIAACAAVAVTAWFALNRKH